MTDIEKALVTYLYDEWSKIHSLDYPLSGERATFVARVRAFRQWLWSSVGSSDLIGFTAEFERQGAFSRPNDNVPAPQTAPQSAAERRAAEENPTGSIAVLAEILRKEQYGDVAPAPLGEETT